MAPRRVLFGSARLLIPTFFQRSIDQLLPILQKLCSLLLRLRSVVEQRGVCELLTDRLELRGLLKFMLLLSW